MSKKHLIILSILFTVNLNAKSQTSLEEYNYLTKGYQIYKEYGGDMKRGYEMQFIDQQTSGDRDAILLAFKKSSNKQVVAYLLIYSYYSSKLQKTIKEYICIPHPDSNESIKNQFWGQLENSGDTAARLRVIAFLLARNLNWN